MCGIAGIAAWRPENSLDETVSRMIATLAHRGPDDQGIWSDAPNGVSIGHRRLSILDLSSQGHQPMISASERYVIAYNGEIYNFRQLRHELDKTGKAPRWRGHSDTEILLACIDAWGMDTTIRKATGMFAIALWDRETHALNLVRDRIGEKPLYYGIVDNRLVFGSELHAIRGAAQGKLQIDREALAEFMRFGYVPAPLTIYQGVKKLLPGHSITLRALSDLDDQRPYWSLDCEAQEQYRTRLATENEDDLVDLVHDRLSQAIGLQMIADVPLGAFLSGGVDSSAVVALMQSQTADRVRTFTIGFHEDEFDEAPYARAVAEHLGTDHTELYVSAEQATALIPELPSIYDEPFADPSQIPTTLVSRLTRQHVTVSLSGDGGDELFSGYPRYQTVDALWRRVGAQPMPVRRALSSMLGSLSAKGWDNLLQFLPAHQRQRINGHRVHRLAQLLARQDMGQMYLRLISQWQPQSGLVLGTGGQTNRGPYWPRMENNVEAMRRWDLQQFLPDGMLVKVDRASMSASLEARAPLLDHSVVELAFALPPRMLVRDGVGKWVLRRVLDRYVPRHLVERPKAGFSIPLAQWLRGPLHDWAESLIDPVRLEAEGLLDPRQVCSMWKQHTSGSYDRAAYLWNILMFQVWRDHENEYPVDSRCGRDR